MKKLVLAFATAAAFAGLPSFALAAPSVDAQSTAAVQAMLDAMEIRKTMTAMFAQTQQAMPGLLRQQVMAMVDADTSMTAQQKKEVLAKVEKMVPTVAQTVGRIFNDPAVFDEMVAAMVPLYANNYTVAEIHQLTAFYQSPIGRKMLATMPKLSAESMAISQRILMPRIGKLMQEVMQEVQKP